ncbi:hypothetical protein MBLNU13_g03289t1 [Cladosporium sp. NU13]
MNSTTTNFKAFPITADHDARNLAIIYGSLGTLIAFASLIFAILSWKRSRHHRLSTHHGSNDLELGINTPRDTTRTPQEFHGREAVSHNDPHQTTSTPSIDITQPQPPSELEGDAAM